MKKICGALLLIGVLALLAGSGCESEKTPVSSSPEGAAMNRSTFEANGLKYEAWCDGRYYSYGDEVRAGMSLENVSDTSIRLHNQYYSFFNIIAWSLDVKGMGFIPFDIDRGDYRKLDTTLYPGQIITLPTEEDKSYFSWKTDWRSPGAGEYDCSFEISDINAKVIGHVEVPVSVGKRIAQSMPHEKEKTVDGIRMYIGTNDDDYFFGDTIVIETRLENLTSESAHVSAYCIPEFAVTLINDSGKGVWGTVYIVQWVFSDICLRPREVMNNPINIDLRNNPPLEWDMKRQVYNSETDEYTREFVPQGDYTLWFEVHNSDDGFRVSLPIEIRDD